MSVNSASGPAWTPLAVVTTTRSTADRSSSSAWATCSPAPAFRACTQRSAGPPRSASTRACGDEEGIPKTTSARSSSSAQREGSGAKSPAMSPR